MVYLSITLDTGSPNSTQSQSDMTDAVSSVGLSQFDGIYRVPDRKS